MTKEEFESWWKENWSCCTASECNREAYGLVRELLAGARERIASVLEKEGWSGASAFVRMMTVDGFGNPELDLWPAEKDSDGDEGSLPVGRFVLADPGGTIKATAGTGRTLQDTTHQYPGLEEYRKNPASSFPKGKCKNNCGAFMSPMAASAPLSIDPFGDCPALENKPFSS